MSSKDNPELNLDETITLPLYYFKISLLGIRDKCVPWKEITEIIQQTPNHEKYFHIQSNKDSLPLVWDKSEWRESGEKKHTLQVEMDSRKAAADRLFELMKKKMPTIDGNLLKHLCLQYIHQDIDLNVAPYFIKKEEYMN